MPAIGDAFNSECLMRVMGRGLHSRSVVGEDAYRAAFLVNGTVCIESSICRLVSDPRLWTGFEWLVRDHESLTVSDTNTSRASVSEFLESIRLVDK